MGAKGCSEQPNTHNTVIPTQAKLARNPCLNIAPKYNLALCRKIKAWVPLVFAKANTGSK